jgi:hypothetical protein
LSLGSSHAGRWLTEWALGIAERALGRADRLTDPFLGLALAASICLPAKYDPLSIVCSLALPLSLSLFPTHRYIRSPFSYLLRYKHKKKTLLEMSKIKKKLRKTRNGEVILPKIKKQPCTLANSILTCLREWTKCGCVWYLDQKATQKEGKGQYTHNLKSSGLHYANVSLGNHISPLLVGLGVRMGRGEVVAPSFCLSFFPSRCCWEQKKIVNKERRETTKKWRVD